MVDFAIAMEQTLQSTTVTVTLRINPFIVFPYHDEFNNGLLRQRFNLFYLFSPAGQYWSPGERQLSQLNYRGPGPG